LRLLHGGEERRWEERIGREGEGQEKNEKEGEIDSDVQLLKPALLIYDMFRRFGTIACHRLTDVD